MTGSRSCNARSTKRHALLIATAVAGSLGFSGGAGGAPRAAPDQQWVLVDTQVDPAGEPPPGGWGVTTTASSMTVVQSFGIDDPSGAEAVFEASWTPPPDTIAAGAPVVVPVTVAGRNTGNLDTQYFFHLDVILLVDGRWNGQAVGAGANCAQTTVISGEYVCSEPDATTGEFSATAPASGASFSLGIGALNCGSACLVAWTYELRQGPGAPAADGRSDGSPAATGTGEWGIIDRDGVLQLIPPPDGVLSISRGDLPEWARDQIVTAGAMIANVGPPDTVAEGDPRVLIDGAPVARLGDPTSHGGSIVEGSERILVDGRPAALLGGFAVCPMVTPPVPHVGGPIVSLGSQEAYLSLHDPVFREATLTVHAVETFQAYIDRWGSGPNSLPFALQHLRDDLARARTTAAARAGDTRIDGDFEGFEPGDGVVIGGEHTDIGIVADTGSIILDRPLVHDHPAGSPALRVDAELIARARSVPPTAQGDTPGGDLADGPDAGSPVAVLIVAAAVVVVLLAGGWTILGRRRTSTGPRRQDASDRSD